MGTPLGLKYIPYTYMHPLGWACSVLTSLEHDEESKRKQTENVPKHLKQ